MPGLVTLPSERLETIARLWDAELPAWAYATGAVRGPGLTADEFIGAIAFLRLARQMKGSLFFSLIFSKLFWHALMPYLSFQCFCSLDNPLPPILSPALLPAITIPRTEALPMLLIVGGSVGGGCVLLICVITLVSLCCRHTGKGELNG